MPCLCIVQFSALYHHSLLQVHSSAGWKPRGSLSADAMRAVLRKKLSGSNLKSRRILIPCEQAIKLVQVPISCMR